MPDVIAMWNAAAASRSPLQQRSTPAAFPASRWPARTCVRLYCTRSCTTSMSVCLHSTTRATWPTYTANWQFAAPGDLAHITSDILAAGVASPSTCLCYTSVISASGNTYVPTPTPTLARECIVSTRVRADAAIRVGTCGRHYTTGMCTTRKQQYNHTLYPDAPYHKSLTYLLRATAASHCHLDRCGLTQVHSPTCQPVYPHSHSRLTTARNRDKARPVLGPHPPPDHTLDHPHRTPMPTATRSHTPQ